MTDQWETIAREGFQFFGKMSASISHEIKNALAIINESAGLLEDFSLLAEKGRPIDPERLKLLARSVSKQVQRADGLVKKMNRFAHSADDAIRIFDLGEILDLVVSLVQRSGRHAGGPVGFGYTGSSGNGGHQPFLTGKYNLVVSGILLD